MSESKSSNTGTIILVILLLASLAGNAYLFMEMGVIQTHLDATETQLDATMDLKDQIANELEETSEQLAYYGGMAENLDKLLGEAKEKIEAQKAKINSLFKKNMDEKSLRAAIEKELAVLRSFREEYLEKVDELLQENAALMAQNAQLSENLQMIEAENAVLSEKVNVASALRVEGMQAYAMKERKSGKTARTMMARKASIIKVCIDIRENAMAEEGEHVLVIRVVNADGVVVQGTDRESFVPIDAEGEVKFSFRKTIEFDGGPNSSCADWKPSTTFRGGTYKVEVYSDGYLTGIGGFELK